jgi:hypothetical protein
MTYGKSPYAKVSYGKTAEVAAAGASGSLAKTNNNDSISASGTTIIVGSLAYTNQNDTVAASGASGLDNVGSLSTVNANDSLSASGTTTVLGSANHLNNNDSVSSIGFSGVITGSVAYVNQNDIAQAIGIGATVTGGGGYGYGYGYVKRKTTVKEDREKLGIIPKSVKKIIKKVAEENATFEKEEEALAELKTILSSKKIDVKKSYEDELKNQIERSVNLEIYKLLKIQKERNDQDEEEAAFWLLM